MKLMAKAEIAIPTNILKWKFLIMVDWPNAGIEGLERLAHPRRGWKPEFKEGPCSQFGELACSTACDSCGEARGRCDPGGGIVD